jgi:CheY-like chemotaxis protein
MLCGTSCLCVLSCCTWQVAEDNRINQKVLRMMLQANCAELTIVSDGEQAVEAFQTVR